MPSPLYIALMLYAPGGSLPMVACPPGVKSLNTLSIAAAASGFMKKMALPSGGSTCTEIGTGEHI